MPLSRIRIESFRCLTHVELDLDPERNFFFGPNGAGKTSLLEAIHVLGRGRSFRLRQSRRLIQYDAPGFLVFGEVVSGGISGSVDGEASGGVSHRAASGACGEASGRASSGVSGAVLPEGAVGARRHRLGIRVDADGRQLRLDGEKAPPMTALAQILPVYVIEPSVHFLIEGGPSERRRFLDWGVFHVEQGYIAIWRRYRRWLGQRNAALRTGQDATSWDDGMTSAGVQITAARERYVEKLRDALAGLGGALLGQPLDLNYRPGWRAGDTLGDALRNSQPGDALAGVTRVGPHRAELEIRLGARSVREEISRGQQKLAAAALVLAQVHVLARVRGHGGTLLVDDPAAELDEGALRRLMAVLDALPAQRIVTSLDPASLPLSEGRGTFHVEQGRVRPVL